MQNVERPTFIESSVINGYLIRLFYEKLLENYFVWLS